MLELAGMERNRVFDRTPVETGRAGRLHRPGSRLIRLTRGGLSVAACLFIAVGLGRVLLDTGDGQPGLPAMNIAGLSPVALDWNAFSRCLSGPGGLIDPGCREADLDVDGDVDLADFRQFQMAYQTAYP